MTFTIRIEPRSPFGTDRDERLADAQALANEIAQLDGVEKTECLETFQKGSGIFENPVVVAALITASGQVVVALINNLFQLLREKREKGKYEAFSLHIHNTHFHLANDTEAWVKAEIKKMIEDALQKKERNQLWTVRRPGESELLGRFFVSGFGPIPPAEKMAICRHLGISLTPDTLLEATSQSADGSFLPPEPDFRGENGRKFWVYQMDQQLPV